MHTARIPPVELAAATITAVPAMHAGHIGLSSRDFQTRPQPFHFASRPDDDSASRACSGHTLVRCGAVVFGLRSRL